MLGSLASSSDPNLRYYAVETIANLCQYRTSSSSFLIFSESLRRQLMEEGIFHFLRQLALRPPKVSPPPSSIPFNVKNEFPIFWETLEGLILPYEGTLTVSTREASTLAAASSAVVSLIQNGKSTLLLFPWELT